MGMTFGLQAGGRAHAANEYFVIKGKGKTPGMAIGEKYFITTISDYAKTTSVPNRPKYCFTLPADRADSPRQ